MDLQTLLPSQAVRVLSDVTSKKRLIQRTAEIASELLPLSSNSILDALVDRENLGATGVGNGVALPHARLAGVEGVTGVFVRLERPIDFEAVDRQPVDLVFALLAPEDAGVEHLKALALVSRTLRDESLCAKLRANSNPATLHLLLTGGEAPQAA
ncbi:MAG: PTS sugar transporter subunit IIA [Pseudomonadota bacterium]